MSTPPPPSATSPSSDLNPWNPGEAVGRYTLLARIAVGGMAEIWLARQTGPRGFEKVVVIKRILETYSADPEFVEMFLDEARIAAQLSHPNIVQTWDLGEHRGGWYIAMEYLAGETLAGVRSFAGRARQLLPMPLSMRIIASASEGLAYAHTRLGSDGKPLGIVHRDVSPQNILVSYDGQVKVVDFGIAKAANRVAQTSGGKVKGKLGYMAPEQATGQELDARTDVFALGVVAWECVVGRRLFKADDEIQIITRILDANPVPLAHTANPEVPVELSKVLAPALEKNRDHRYPDAVTFQRALEAWLKTVGAPASSDLATMMQGYFGARIKERNTLIEQAARGELTPAHASAVLKPDTNPSVPTGASVEVPLPRPSSKTPVVFVVAGVLLLGAVGLIAREASRPDAVPPPAKLSADLSLDTEPRGALVLVDGKEAGRSPVTVSGLSPGAHAVTAKLAGRREVSRQVQVAAGEKATVVLDLQPEQATAQPVDPNTADAGAVAAVSPSTVPSEPRAGRGKLTLQTTPWTRVSLKGKELGDTPLVEFPLPAGRLSLKLINEDKKISKTIEVIIKAGQTTALKLKL